MRINRDEQLSFGHSWESECLSCSLKDGQVSWRNLSVEICYFNYDKNKPMCGLWEKAPVLCFLLDSPSPAQSVEECALITVFNRNRQVSLCQVIARCLDDCISCLFSRRESLFERVMRQLEAMSFCFFWKKYLPGVQPYHDMKLKIHVNHLHIHKYSIYL